MELGIPLTDLGDTTFVVGTIVLPPLDVQLLENLGGNGVDVGGMDAMRHEKGLDWSGHGFESEKEWVVRDSFLRPIYNNSTLNNFIIHIPCLAVFD